MAPKKPSDPKLPVDPSKPKRTYHTPAERLALKVKAEEKAARVRRHRIDDIKKQIAGLTAEANRLESEIVFRVKAAELALAELSAMERQTAFATDQGVATAGIDP